MNAASSSLDIAGSRFKLDSVPGIQEPQTLPQGQPAPTKVTREQAAESLNSSGLIDVARHLLAGPTRGAKAGASVSLASGTSDDIRRERTQAGTTSLSMSSGGVSPHRPPVTLDELIGALNNLAAVIGLIHETPKPDAAPGTLGGHLTLIAMSLS